MKAIQNYISEKLFIGKNLIKQNKLHVDNIGEYCILSELSKYLVSLNISYNDINKIFNQIAHYVDISGSTKYLEDNFKFYELNDYYETYKDYEEQRVLEIFNTICDSNYKSRRNRDDLTEIYVNDTISIGVGRMYGPQKYIYFLFIVDDNNNKHNKLYIIKK